MHTLLLLLLLVLPYNVNGLLCLAKGKYTNNIGNFTNALYELANKTVNNTLIKKCMIIIELYPKMRKMVINYFGDNITDELPDSISLFTLFFFSTSADLTASTLTYVCSSNDYCDRTYVENWSQWLFNINFIEYQNDIKEFFRTNDNDNYPSNTCYNMTKIEECSTSICYSLNNKGKVIAKCAEMDIIPSTIKLLIKNMAWEKIVNVTILTTITMENFWQKDNSIHSDQYKHQLNHSISYFCGFNQCNSPTISEGLTNKINMIYDVKKMLNFVISTQDETNLLSITHSTSTEMTDSANQFYSMQGETNFIPITHSTSTEITDSGNQYYSISFIVFIFIYILRCLFIQY